MASPTVPAVFDEPRALSAAATLCDAFQITASENADRVTLRMADGSLEITWAQYAERVRRIAGGLASLTRRHRRADDDQPPRVQPVRHRCVPLGRDAVLDIQHVGA